MLEAIRAWPARGEGALGSLEHVVRRLVADGRIRPKELAKAVHREPPAVRAALEPLLTAAA